MVREIPSAISDAFIPLILLWETTDDKSFHPKSTRALNTRFVDVFSDYLNWHQIIVKGSDIEFPKFWGRKEKRFIIGLISLFSNTSIDSLIPLILTWKKVQKGMNVIPFITLHCCLLVSYALSSNIMSELADCGWCSKLLACVKGSIAFEGDNHPDRRLMNASFHTRFEVEKNSKIEAESDTLNIENESRIERWINKKMRLEKIGKTVTFMSDRRKQFMEQFVFVWLSKEGC